jgi:hypothetical protein
MKERLFGLASSAAVKCAMAVALTAYPALAATQQVEAEPRPAQAHTAEDQKTQAQSAATSPPAAPSQSQDQNQAPAEQSQVMQASAAPDSQEPQTGDSPVSANAAQSQENQSGQAQQPQQPAPQDPQNPPNQQAQPNPSNQPGQQDQSAQPGQQNQPQAGQQNQPPQPGQTAQPGRKVHEGTSNDRMFFALPNYLTIENSAQLKPLTAGQKFKAVARGAFDPVQVPYYAIVAGIGQAANSEPGYGQGAEGYGKRYGATAADGVIENFMVGAVFPSILRTDPRYYQMGKGGFFHRTEYAISRLFVTRTDSGHPTFNASEIFGSAFAAGISTYSYHPGNDRTLSNTASVWGTQMGQDAISAMLKEFWPDLRRKFDKFKKK